MTVVEFLDRILPGIDGEVAAQFQRMLEKQGFAFHLAHKVAQVEASAAGAKATIEPVAGGKAKCSKPTSCWSHRTAPFYQGLGLEALGVAMERGQIVIDSRFATNVAGLYAIGDVVRGPTLAHKAEDEGARWPKSWRGRRATSITT